MERAGEGNGVAWGGKGWGVEGVGHEGDVPSKRRINRCLDGVGVRMKHKFAVLRIERTQHDGVRQGIPWRKNTSSEVEKVTAVGQEKRPPVRGLILGGVQCGNGSERTARGRDADRRSVDRASYDNVSV